MSLFYLACCVNIKNSSTVVTSVPAAGVCTPRVSSSHQEPCTVLALGIKMSSFKITFSLLISLTFSLTVLMQTNRSWKAAKVGPRSLRTVTMFSAGRVGTWAGFAHSFIYLSVFSLLQLNASFPYFVTSGRLYVCMREVGEIALFLHDRSVCVLWSQNVSIWNYIHVSCVQLPCGNVLLYDGDFTSVFVMSLILMRKYFDLFFS